MSQEPQGATPTGAPAAPIDPTLAPYERHFQKVKDTFILYESRLHAQEARKNTAEFGLSSSNSDRAPMRRVYLEVIGACFDVLLHWHNLLLVTRDLRRTSETWEHASIQASPSQAPA